MAYHRFEAGANAFGEVYGIGASQAGLEETCQIPDEQSTVVTGVEGGSLPSGDKDQSSEVTPATWDPKRTVPIEVDTDCSEGDLNNVMKQALLSIRSRRTAGYEHSARVNRTIAKRKAKPIRQRKVKGVDGQPEKKKKGKSRISGGKMDITGEFSSGSGLEQTSGPRRLREPFEEGPVYPPRPNEGEDENEGDSDADMIMRSPSASPQSLRDLYPSESSARMLRGGRDCLAGIEETASSPIAVDSPVMGSDEELMRQYQGI